MNRLIASLKVLTLFNLKIYTILIILGLSVYFGFRYIEMSEVERKCILTNIQKNEDNNIKKTKIVNNIITTDGKLLSKALNKQASITLINKEIDIIRESTKSIDRRLVSIINEKERLYQDINNFDEEYVDFNNIKSIKSVSIVSKNVKKSLFRTKIDYDTIYKKYNDIDKNVYYLEYNRIIKLNSEKLNKLIYRNNELTLEMKLIIDDYSREQIDKSISDNQVLLSRLKENTNIFIIKSFITALVVGILLYLIIIDIRRIKKSSNRNAEVMSFLMEKTKDLIAKKNK